MSPLPREVESLLAAIVALEAGRSFDGNAPAATLGLTSQLIGIEGEPGDGPWQVRLVARGAPRIELSDGPLLGRYWVGAERSGEIVVRVRDGLLDSMEYAWSGTEPVRWPEPGEITVG
ncbi:MAG TPA: hypothetical protein GXZ30_04550 [Propionibacterium sp.]|nr:hypothetical protein [Propionibacterium sp.]